MLSFLDRYAIEYDYFNIMKKHTLETKLVEGLSVRTDKRYYCLEEAASSNNCWN
jgi:hypothetical protein